MQLNSNQQILSYLTRTAKLAHPGKSQAASLSLLRLCPVSLPLSPGHPECHPVQVHPPTSLPAAPRPAHSGSSFAGDLVPTHSNSHKVTAKNKTEKFSLK